MASESNTEPGNASGAAHPPNDGQGNSEQPDSKSPDRSKKDAQVPTTTQHGHSTEQQKHWLDYAIFWAALVAALASSAAAGFTGWQAWIAKDTAKRQLRGYIVIGSNDHPKVVEGEQPFVSVILQNLGQTPIHDGAWVSGLNVAAYPLLEDITFDDCRKVMNHPTATKWIIGKQSPTEKWRTTPFQKSEVKDIQDGKAVLYFIGRICYRDIFEEVRHTDFCMYWKWENGRLGNGLTCQTGNGSS